MSKWKIIQRDERNRYECEYTGYESKEEAEETAQYWEQEDKNTEDDEYYGTHYYEVVEVI